MITHRVFLGIEEKGRKNKKENKSVFLML